MGERLTIDGLIELLVELSDEGYGGCPVCKSSDDEGNDLSEITEIEITNIIDYDQELYFASDYVDEDDDDVIVGACFW